MNAKKDDTLSEAVQAARGELSGDDPGAPTEDLMTEAALTVGHLDPEDRPAGLTVGGVRYLWMPEIGEYASDDGDLLDLKTKEAVKALVLWRKQRAQLEAVAAAQQERSAAGPDDLHMFHVERPEAFGEFELGRRWVPFKGLQPGSHGNEGLRAEHGVVVRWSPDTDDNGRKLTEAEKPKHVRLLHFRIVHIDEKAEIVSLEPGERLRPHAVTFYPKPYVRDWLTFISAVEGTTVDRYVNKMVHQAYAISDVRTAMVAGSGMAGKVGANADLQHDLAAGRKARAAG